MTMQPLLYSELVPFYHLLDPADDHALEAHVFRDAILRVTPGAKTLLELGSGAGHNAVHLKRWFRCTLSDVSPHMLDRSRTLNPECAHHQGDMRSLRLAESFDAVLIHDAICYMLTPADLRAAADTTFVHTRPGGVAILAPDCVRETFRAGTNWHEGDDAERSLRCIEWVTDPDPGDDTYVVDYGFLLRDATGVRGVHDRHVEGLFSRSLWLETLGAAGFLVESLARPLGEYESDQVFLCRRPP
jgi:hypothetical protein